MEVDVAPALMNAPTSDLPSLSNYNFLTTLMAGGIAGVVVDIALFPIDSVKTRLQSELGFWRSGGFRGIYKGLAPVAAGSAPTAALFFCAYEGFKKHLGHTTGVVNSPYVHMASASCAEVLACLIRVPVEVAKQRRQALSGKQQLTAIQILWKAYKTEGLRRGIYVGFGSTMMREIPFSLIQFPLWEYFKLRWPQLTGLDLSPLSVALCGAVAGGISAGLTTPLDVIKTRIMLSEQNSITRNSSFFKILSSIYRDRGITGVFAGFVPRVLWITLGGAIFFGFYDLTTRTLNRNSNNTSV